MPKNDTLSRVGDAQLEAFERKRQKSHFASNSLESSLTHSTSSTTSSSSSFSTPESNQESIKSKVPLVPPPTTLFPNPGKDLSNVNLPISPVSPSSEIPLMSSIKEPLPLPPNPSISTTSSISSSFNTSSPTPSSLSSERKETLLSSISNEASKQGGDKKIKGLPLVTKDSIPPTPSNPTSTPVSLSLQPLPSSPNANPSLGSILLMNGQQKVHFIETQFRLLTQSFKEKVAQPLFGTETQVTRFQDAEEANLALEQMQTFYLHLHEFIMNYHRSLQQVMEQESELARMMLEWGYKSPPDSEIGSALVTCGTAFQAQSNSFATYVKSIVTFRDQLKAFLQHALKDAQETRKKQEEIRKEWDAAHLKLLPSLKLPHLENDHKLVSWIPGFNSTHTTTTPSSSSSSSSSTSSDTTSSSTHLGMDKPGSFGNQERKKSSHVTMTHPFTPEVKPDELNPNLTQLGQKLTDLTTGLVQKCAILQQKSSSDLTQQLWSIRKQSALYHSSALDSMMMSSSSGSSVDHKE